MTEENPLVSIIVITYNSSKYVLETLESVKEQTYRNIELIISDDCSTDNTVEICREWLQKHKERFIRTEIITVSKNTGIPANCNRGVKAAKGDWVKLIAGDDMLLPTCIDHNILICINKKFNILQTNLNYFNGDFNIKNFIKSSTLEEKPFFQLPEPKLQYKHILLGNNVLAPSIFIKKEIIINAGFFDESIPLIEDLPFWTKVTRKGYVISFNETITVNYRISSQSVVNEGGILMTKRYAENLLLYSKKYKKGNTNWLHYLLYNLSLNATIILHKFGITGKSEYVDKVFALLIYKIRKIA